MKALILVGGLGTRLRPYTFSIPKPLLPFGERPILQCIIEQLRTHEITDIILATGYHAELIRAVCGDGSQFEVSVRYVHEEKSLGTAGPLALARDLIDPDELFIVMNGDIITDLNFARFVAFSRSHDFDLTIGYTRYVYQSPFGVLTIDGDQVRAIEEKPSTEYAISGGIYAMKGSILDHVPDDTFFTMPQLIQTLIASGRRVGAYDIKEYWIGLESVAHFDEAMKHVNEGRLEVAHATNR